VIHFLPGVYASSRHIPGVRFAGIPHPGIIGTAPSAELLQTWNRREKELREAHAEVMPPVAHLPLSVGTYVGQALEEAVRDKIANEGARTLPGRENGGNCDVSSSLTSLHPRCSIHRQIDKESFQVNSYIRIHLYLSC